MSAGAASAANGTVSGETAAGGDGPGEDGVSTAAMQILRPASVFRAFAAPAPAMTSDRQGGFAFAPFAPAPAGPAVVSAVPQADQASPGARPPATVLGAAGGIRILADRTPMPPVATSWTGGSGWGSPGWIEARTYPIPSRFGAVLGWPLQPQPPLPLPRRSPEPWTSADN